MPSANLATTKRGREGEAHAALFLEEKGLQILEKNYRSRFGEVDIIARDFTISDCANKVRETIVFVEVKSWQTYGIDSLAQAINIKKQKKIIETAKYFLSINRKYRYMAVRFDVIFISPNKNIAQERITQSAVTHLVSAFMESV
jgi:putative endonuclease